MNGVYIGLRKHAVGVAVSRDVDREHRGNLSPPPQCFDWGLPVPQFISFENSN